MTSLPGGQLLRGPEKQGEQQTIYSFILSYFKHSRRSSLICKHLAQTEIIIYGDVWPFQRALSASLGSETSYKGRRFQIRRGLADPHLPPSSPPSSLLPREEKCFKDETSQGYHLQLELQASGATVSSFPQSRLQEGFLSHLFGSHLPEGNRATSLDHCLCPPST